MSRTFAKSFAFVVTNAHRHGPRSLARLRTSFENARANAGLGSGSAESVEPALEVGMGQEQVEEVRHIFLRGHVLDRSGDKIAIGMDGVLNGHEDLVGARGKERTKATTEAIISKQLCPEMSGKASNSRFRCISETELRWRK